MRAPLPLVQCVCAGVREEAHFYGLDILADLCTEQAVTRGGAAECTPLGRRDVIHILTRVPFSENAVTNVRKDIIRFQGDITLSGT